MRNAEEHYRIQAAKVEEIITPKTGEQWMASTFKQQSCDELAALISITSFLIRGFHLAAGLLDLSLNKLSP